LRVNLSKLSLFGALQSSTGAWFSTACIRRLQANPQQFEVPLPLAIDELAELNTRVRAVGGDSEELLDRVKSVANVKGAYPLAHVRGAANP